MREKKKRLNESDRTSFSIDPKILSKYTPEQQEILKKLKHHPEKFQAAFDDFFPRL